MASFFPPFFLSVMSYAICTYNVAAGEGTMTVSLAASVSVIGLIIDASIPAGGWPAAKNTSVA